MSSWFNDKEHPENASKRLFLKEIFKVARAEERYMSGEIDATTLFPVKGLAPRVRAKEIKVEEGEDYLGPSFGSVSMPTQDSLVSLAIGLNPYFQQMDIESSPMISKMRQNAHRPIDSAFYSRGMGFQPYSPNIQDRCSLASPGSLSPQQAMYDAWQTKIASNGPGLSSYDTTYPQSALTASSAPLPQQPHSNGPRDVRYDTGPALDNQLRTGSIRHQHHIFPRIHFKAISTTIVDSVSGIQS